HVTIELVDSEMPEGNEGFPHGPVSTWHPEQESWTREPQVLNDFADIGSAKQFEQPRFQLGGTGVFEPVLQLLRRPLVCRVEAGEAGRLCLKHSECFCFLFRIRSF